jgi:hypothetical protein
MNVAAKHTMTFERPQAVYMPDQPTQSTPNDKFKADMPEIPGVSSPGAKPASSGFPWLVMAGLVAVLVAIFVGGRLLSKPRRGESAVPAASQTDSVARQPDLAAAVPVVTEQGSAVAQVGDLPKAWSSREFTFRNRVTGETVNAILVRLPGSPAGQSSGYWSVAMKAAYGSCQLEYVEDLEKLRDDYGYRVANHPMVGNPCTRSLYDPLKYAPIPGNVLARGAVVQGSDLRPPLGIEVKVQGKQILAARME